MIDVVSYKHGKGEKNMHFTNFPHSSGIYPRYQHGDFNTNSESYYKYLASLNEQLDNFVKL